ncbi:hypothetical protein D3C74_412600 [compost metagenome]
MSFLTLAINKEKKTISGTCINTEKRMNQPLFFTETQKRSSPSAFLKLARPAYLTVSDTPFQLVKL